jgi:hypothetical protein
LVQVKLKKNAEQSFTDNGVPKRELGNKDERGRDGEEIEVVVGVGGVGPAGFGGGAGTGRVRGVSDPACQ